ncbi:MAG: domain containing protein [Naasia sp.]|nr:domain containing protein [Naasia sp.]
MLLRTRFRGASATAVTAAALALIGSLLTAPAAHAETTPAAGQPATVSSDALPTAQVNGVVWASVVVGNTVYVGGQFTQAQPPGAGSGVGVQPRSNLMAFNLTTGALLPWAPGANGIVRSIAASPDGSRLYVGGDFTSIDGTGRSRIAALNPSSGAVLADFRPSANNSVYAIATNGNTVYFGGSFTAIGGQSRTRAAAVTATNTVTAFNPVIPDFMVRGLVVAPDGSRVVLGGSFSSLNGGTNPGRGMGMVDSATGRSNQPWAVGQVVVNYGQNAAVWSLSSDGSNVYGTAYDYRAGDQGNLEGAFNASLNGGAINWIEDCHGDSYSTAALGDVVYLAGHPHYCGNIGGYPQTPQPWKNHNAVAFSKARTGTITANTVGGSSYFNFAGRPAPTLLTWYPDFTIGTFTGQNQAAWSVSAGGNYVVYGGEFPTVNGQRQTGLVRFAAPDAAPNDDGPRLWSNNFRPNLQSVAPGQVRVSWQANYDRDNEELTYQVLRNGAVAYTMNARSRSWWDRPVFEWTDTGRTAGSSVSYAIRAVDPHGNTATGTAVAITVSGADRAGAYADTVLADNPRDYWRFSETSGTAVADMTGPFPVTGTGVTRNAGGALAGDSDPAATFAGSSSSYASTRTYDALGHSYSVEAWFRTDSTTGGKIVGFGDAATGSSAVTDRNVYMNANGQVLFGVDNGARRTITSLNRYNNNEWHHVVATLGANGMRLYVDGAQVASNSGVTSGQGIAGFWRIGGDSSWSGSAWYRGSIDEVAIYEAQLSAAQVSAHYQAGRTGQGGGGQQPPANSSPTASFTSSTSGLTASVNGTGSTDSDGTVASYAWTFGDGATATGATASRTYATAGTYNVTLTVTDDAGATGTTTRSVTVTAPGGGGTNAAPTAAIGGTMSGATVNASGSGSRDTDGTIASYAWDFGDGGTGTGVTASHTYTQSGSYTVRLTVTDDDGATGTATRTISVTVPGGGGGANAAPVAAIGGSLNGRAANASGAGSRDTDGTIVSYAWNFGDGGTATGVTTTHVYASAGTYTVRLTVTDDDGATGTTTMSIRVN